MFIKNNRRFNINQYLSGVFIDDNGIQHPGSRLRDEQFRLDNGITEIADPVRGDDETQYTQEIDVDPWVIITDKSPEQLEEVVITKCSNHIQNMLDDKAKELGYDSVISACTYLNSGNTTFAAEALQLATWRDACWTYANDVKVNNTYTTFEDFVAGIPAFV